MRLPLTKPSRQLGIIPRSVVPGTICAPGYRAYLVDQHLIIYRITHNAVIVLRVLHARADARRALRGR
jgi:plasmid stabilization system protein ParE